MLFLNTLLNTLGFEDVENLLFSMFSECMNGFESHRLRQTGPLDVEIPRGFNFVLFGYRWVQI